MKVAIIGGGLAGIAAAYTLLANSKVTEVHLLEATGRYGGRACTDTTSIAGFAFDKGAQYIQDPGINPLTQIAKQLDFETVEEEADYMLRVETGDGWVSEEPFRNRDVQHVIDRIEVSYEKAREHPNVIVSARPDKVDNAELFGHAASTYGPFTESAESWQYIAADRAREAGGNHGPNLFVKRGIGSLVAAYGEDIRSKRGDRYFEHFEAIVSKIVYDDTQVTLGFNSESLVVDACIVTVPVSILGNDGIAFAPELPPAHRNALTVLRLGSYKKLALRLRTPPEDIVPGTNYFLIENEPAGVWQYYRLPHAPDVLVAHAAGDFAAVLDAIADDEVIKLFKDRIKTACKDVCFTTGEAITNWSKEPFARGAYSYTAFKGGGPDDPDALAARETLRKPVKRLYFAGEATNIEYYGTLQAAYFEGVRAAQEALT
ncbi:MULTISPECIES: NAD(P)/FAD-dependent oxidoreductase [Paraburkholderia]|uniref:flavin monoamine oxidase family protein n=1 Tax=Paraburkholderia TaxID=1822464 RepID=UPI00224F1CE8|nr:MULTISPECIES: NAD(P)/FAD-dependent oxidoreductase [Paraburkholderia]MCX4161512.1 NAD(P)/FAD-dependent oxidoreductase [Paraburkholderia megapolitana]MDN7157008.1 FAD-dependent oxidoreductase [Paraburkholderia sp. CHISQ3]MDQ6494053.1 FAD-dependent oxidoreductase [Paraburkholderia megapolitana]